MKQEEYLKLSTPLVSSIINSVLSSVDIVSPDANAIILVRNIFSSIYLFRTFVKE